MKIDGELWPLLVKAIADKRFSNNYLGSKSFQDELDQRLAEQNDTVVEQKVDSNGNVTATLASPKMTGNVCEICGNPVFGWSRLCSNCAKGDGDGVRE